MTNPKAHTFFQLFNGTGDPPSPFTFDSAGGASAPTQVNGALHFPGVGVGGSSSNIYLSTPLDLTNDALFLQFESIIGQPGTIELTMFFASNWNLTLQLRGLNWNVILMHGATVVQNKTVSVDEAMVPDSPPTPYAFLIPNFQPLSWEVAYQPTTDTAGTLEVMWGPSPEQMRAPYVILDLPVASAQDLTDVWLSSKNYEAQSVTYGETRLIGFNAWSPAAAYIIPTTPTPTPLTGGTTFSGLTGHGTLAMDPGTRAVRVNWTESFSALGWAVGAPNKYFGVGWVNFSNGTISEGPQFVDFQDQVLSPTTPQNASHLGYSFAPSVTAQITCLT